MNTNSITANGISVCPEAEERYVYFNLTPRPRKKSRYCQYDYRLPSGELFSTVAPTLEQCRQKRNQWLREQELQQAHQSDCKHYIPASYSVCSSCRIGGYCHFVCRKFQRADDNAEQEQDNI